MKCFIADRFFSQYFFLRLERPRLWNIEKEKKRSIHCVRVGDFYFHRFLFFLKEKGKSQVVSRLVILMSRFFSLVPMAFKWQWKACDTQTHTLCNISVVFFTSIGIFIMNFYVYSQMQKKTIFLWKNSFETTQQQW